MNTQTTGKRLNFGLIGLGLAFLGLVIVLIVFLIKRYQEKQKKNPLLNNPIVERETNQTTINDQKETFAQIEDYCISLGIAPNIARAIAGQSAHETGRYKSELAINYNNIFGMKDGGGGQGIQSGVVKGFATYTDWEHSVDDLVTWLKAKGLNLTDNELQTENYLQFLKSKGYYEDSLANYKKSVISLINELKS